MTQPATAATPLDVTDPHDHLVRVLADMAEYRQRFPDEPLVAHRPYRLLYDELELLDEMGEDAGRDSPLLRLEPVPVGAVVRHPTPMYPLGMASTAGFQQWAKRLKPRTKLYALPVPYGPTVELVYRGGSFAEAIIHGNGLEGLDVTERLRCSPSVPQTIPLPRPVTSVFVTVGVSDEALTRVNRALRRRGQITPLSARKAALALLSGKAGGAFELRHLVALPYDCPALRLTHKSMRTALAAMIGWGFPAQMVVAGTAANPDAVVELYQRCKRQIDLDLVFDFPAQAIGVFLDDPQLWLVDNDRRPPAFSRLWRIEGETAEAFITHLHHRLGRHGTVLPVATITPVLIDQQQVSEVTLPSVGYAVQEKLGVGSAVRVRLVGHHLPEAIAGDSVPRAEPYTPPSVCPSCGRPLLAVNPHLRCANEGCPAVRLARLVHAASRNCLQLPHLTEDALRALMAIGIVGDLASLFHLTPTRLVPVLTPGAAAATCDALRHITTSLTTNDAVSEHLLTRLLHALSLHGLTPRTIPLLVEQITEQEVFDEQGRPYPMIGFLPHVLTALQTLEAVLPATLAREVWRHAFVRRDELIRLADCFHPTDLESLPT